MKEATAYNAKGEVLRFTFSQGLERFWFNTKDKNRIMRPIRGSAREIACRWEKIKGVDHVVVRVPLGV